MLRLALANIRQRLMRTLITVFAMFLAAAVATSAMSLALGIARGGYSEYRAYYGGDILVFTPTFVGATATPTAHGAVHSAILYDSGFSLLRTIFPHFQTEGYLGLAQFPYVPISEAQLQGLAAQAGVRAVRPKYIMPGAIGRWPVSIRVAAENLAEHLVEGRIPRATGPAGELEVVVNAYGSPLARVGGSITLDVPVFRVGASGVPQADFSQAPRQYTARVVGIAAWPTREITFFRGPEEPPISEQGFVHSSEVYLDGQVWRTLWQEQSRGAPYPVLAVALSVTDLSQLNVTAGALRRAFPALSVMTVPEIARHVERFGLLDQFYRIPAEAWRPADGEVQQAHVPVELGLTGAILMFASAGMLLAGQMLAGLAERRKEIGILKALGARRRDIVGMVLTEGLLLSALGAVLGFVVVRGLAIHRELANQVSWLEVLRGTLEELLVVFGLTVVVALLFSAVPAAKMSQLPVMEVFRSE